ncbi:MOSC domain-containing protein [Candidatus Margulisiibacteriota bacterium]
MKTFKIKSINISAQKSVKKKPIPEAELKVEHGIIGDAHGGNWHRQISMLAMESIQKMKSKGADVNPGDFAENITTEGIDLPSLPIGTKLMLNDTIEVEVTQIGKECHSHCAIYQQVGDCVMPREGIFVKVLTGGILKTGDTGKAL